jgi:hypothetical protein
VFICGSVASTPAASPSSRQARQADADQRDRCGFGHGSTELAEVRCGSAGELVGRVTEPFMTATAAAAAQRMEKLLLL